MILHLTTERLLLRPMTEGDLDLGIALYTDPEAMKYVGGPDTREEVIRLLPRDVRRGGGCIGIWCVTERATGAKLGTAFLLPLPIEDDDTDWDLVVEDRMPDGDVEVGYFLKPAAWGRGIATEACGRMLRFAFEDSPLQEVVAVIEPEHAASRKVLLKCGLTAEGVRRGYAADMEGYRITRAQWLARRAAASASAAATAAGA